MGVVGSGEGENQHLTLLQELRPREQRVEEHDRYNNGSRIGTRRESTRELREPHNSNSTGEEPKREGLRKGKRSSPSSRGGGGGRERGEVGGEKRKKKKKRKEKKKKEREEEKGIERKRRRRRRRRRRGNGEKRRRRREEEKRSRG